MLTGFLAWATDPVTVLWISGIAIGLNVIGFVAMAARESDRRPTRPWS